MQTWYRELEEHKARVTPNGLRSHYADLGSDQKQIGGITLVKNKQLGVEEIACESRAKEPYPGIGALE
jgi:hypothetical protein